MEVIVPAKRVRRSSRVDPDAIAARAAVAQALEADEARSRWRRDSAAASLKDSRRVLTKGHRVEFDATGRVVDGPKGLARWKVCDLETLVEIHDIVKRGVRRPMSWAGGSDAADSRWRCFGLLPGARATLVSSGVSMHSFETRRRDQSTEIRQSWASCVDLEPTQRQRVALETVAAEAAAVVDPAYASDVTYDALVAVQPNVHDGSEFLPRHLDWPRNDGFGVVIVTVAVKRAGTVVVSDDNDRDFYFDLPEGYAYALSADARNLFTHGLFCFGQGDRESLNLRFGIHTQERAKADIYRHWATLYATDPKIAACGPEGPVYDE